MSNHSTNVETNVVQMRFDNKNFEKNVKDTIDSVDKLKKELKFEDSAKSFKTLEENAKKVDFSPLSKGIEKVQASFSFLDTFSATVYHRLSNRLIDLGKKITTSVSTEGIKSGFSEYELKMNSFKTIKASAGKDFTDSQINEYLEELNRYADKTIYSFSDMTNNIGKFTNAGVKLDVAVKAIQGISNEAAISGANAQEASRAMYNFSQALSAGYVKLIDWKSIENANMATEEFKTQLLETAVALKKVTKAENGMYKTTKGTLLNATHNFNDTLSEQWMTTEVLTKTLEKYADETTEIGKKAFDAAQKVNTFSKLMDTLKESIQSGWSQTWELLIGNLKEATELYTAISNKIGAVIDGFFKEKKLMIETWKDQHGRERVLKAMVTILKNFGDVLHSIRAAWRDIFPKKTANDLLALTVSFENFAKKTKPSRKTLIKIRDTFKGLFATISIALNALKAFKDTFGKFFVRVLGDALHALFGVTGSLGDMLVQVRKSVIENKTFYKVFQSIVNVLEWVYGIVKKVSSVLWNFAGTVKNAVTSLGGLKSIGGWFENFKNAIVNFKISDIASSIWSLFENIGKFIDDVMSKTFDFYTPMKEKFKDAWDKLKNSKVIKGITDFCKGIVDDIQGMFDNMRDVDTSGADELAEETKKKFSFIDAISKVLEFFTKVWEKIKGIAKAIWPYIKSAFKSLGKGIQMLWEGITTNIKNSDMGDAGGLLGGIGVAGLGLGIKNFIDQIKPLVSSFKMLTNGGVLKNVFNILTGATRLIKAKILKEIAVSMILLVGAIFLLCTLPKEKVIGATVAMGILFQGLTSVFNSIDSGAGDSGMENEGKKINTRLFGAAAMIAALAVAMLILTIALRKLAKYKTEDLTKAIIVIGVLFKIISSTITSILNAGQQVAGSKAGSVSIAVTGVAQTIKSLGKCLLLIAAACWILSKAAQNSEGKFEAERIIVPLLALGVIIGLIGVIVVKLQEKIKHTDKEITANKYQGILEGKAGMALTIIALAVFIKQFAKAMLILFAAIAVVAIIAHFTGWKQMWASFALMAVTIVAVLGAMLGTVAILTKIADKFNGKDGKGGLGKLAILIGIVSLFINSIAILFGTLSLIPSDWAATGSGVLLAISASILLVMEGISAVVEASKEAEGALSPKAIVAILGTVTLAIGAIVGCVIALAKTLKDTNPTKALLILGGIAVAIGLIIFAISKWEKVSKAFEVFTKGIAAFGVAAAGFALSALLIITTLRKVSKMSDSEIKAIGENMKKVTTAILTSSDQLVGMIMGLVRNVVKTALETAIFTILDSAETILEGLIGLCDKLLLQAPTLVNKILQILVEVLTELERSMGPLVVQVVSFVATLISDIAQAIVDNADKITKAIDDVITAITTLVVGSVAKILGIDHFKDGINTLINIIKPFTAYLIGMFAYKKVKTGAYGIIKILSSLKTKLVKFIAAFKRGGDGWGTAWREFLGVDKLNESFRTITGQAADATQTITGDIKAMKGNVLSSLGTMAKGILTGAGVGLALGSLVASFIKAKEDAIDATSTWAEDTDNELKDLRDTVDKTSEKLREARKKNKEDIKEVNKEYDTQETMLERLAKLYDPKTGKVLEGHEDEVKSIAEKINTALGIRLELEGKLLNIIDEQGKKRKADLDYLKELNERERLKATLDKNKELIESYKGEGGLLQTTREKKEKAKKKLTQYEDMLKLVEKYEGITNFHFSGRGLTDAEMEVAKNLKTIYQDSDLSEDEIINDIKSVISFQKMQVTSAEQNIRKMEQEIKRYEEGVNAAINGTAEQVHKVNMKYLSGYVEKGAGTTYDMSVALRKQMDMLKAMSLNPGDYDKTQMKQYLEGMMKQMIDLGYNKDTKIEGGYKITLKNQFGADEIKNFDTYGDLYAHYLEAFSNMPELMTEEVANGIEAASKDSKINSAVGSFSDSLKEGTTSSFKDGLSENAKGVLSNYISNKDNTNGVLGFLRADADVNSPSKLYAKEIGEPLGEGIIAGLSNYIDEAMLDGSIDGLMKKLQTSILPAIASLTGNSSLFGGITPVNFGLNQNGSGIYETVPPINGALPYDTHLMNITAILQKHSDNMMNQTNTIIEELGLLRGDVGSLAEHIDSIELRLDGNELVGGITAKMNSSLLRYSNRVGRRQ